MGDRGALCGPQAHLPPTQGDGRDVSGLSSSTALLALPPLLLVVRVPVPPGRDRAADNPQTERPEFGAFDAGRTFDLRGWSS